MNAETPALLVRPLDGFMPNLPAEVYHAHEAMSASGAKKILRSPAHYRLMRTKPAEPTEAMQFGTVVHCGVLEPDRLSSTVCIAPEINRRTNAGKAEYAAFCAENAGRIVMTREDYDRAMRCVDAVRAHPAAAKLLVGAEVEGSLFWRDARYDVPCKVRYDLRNHGGLADLKTTDDASPETFARTIANYLYHVQAAHYVGGAEHVLNESPRFFAFIAVEKEEPHAVACYVLPGNAILAGAHLMNKALERYQAALAAGEWKGYPDTIEAIQLPRYALRFDD